MVTVDTALCNGCAVCVRECPVGAMALEERKAVAGEACVGCGLCLRVCEKGAVSTTGTPDDCRVPCDHCPVQCRILEGHGGACRRYVNRGGRLELARPLVVPAERGPRHIVELAPLVTGVGAGTTSPCFAPAPYIVEEQIEGVDVVTVVSEVPFSYSSMQLKVDTNAFIGEEGATIRRDGRPVGRVETQQYGSKLLAVGGVNTLHGKSGSTAARTIADVCNRREVRLKVEGGPRLDLVLGGPPKVDGSVSGKMRAGCGSATLAMFAPALAAAADEVIVLDPDITGLLSEHLAGRALGLTWSGVVPVGRKSTVGRYFGEVGPGLGGTNVTDARSAVASIDWRVARVGLTLLVTDTAGESAALLRLTEGGELEGIELSAAARRAVSAIRQSAEDPRVSALLIFGAGGSARAGVTRYPIKLNEAVHAGDVRITVGGAPVYLLPGGGITFVVDAERLPPDAVGWVPTPATLAPIEYTMTREMFAKVEGHVSALRPWREVVGERWCVAWAGAATMPTNLDVDRDGGAGR